MEDVLDVYHRDYGEDEVLVCMDETSRQQVRETRVPRPAAPGRPAVYDHEYERNGTSNLFMLFAPLRGWRRVEVTERRTRVDWAHLVRDLLDVDYPDKRVVLVMDNLNTHTPGSLYEAFEPADAAPRPAAGDPLHAEARQLAEHGGDRDRRHGRPVPGPAHPRPRRDAPRGRGVAGAPQPRVRARRLALHHGGCPGQAEVSLSINTNVMRY